MNNANFTNREAKFVTYHTVNELCKHLTIHHTFHCVMMQLMKCLIDLVQFHCIKANRFIVYHVSQQHHFIMDDEVY